MSVQELNQKYSIEDHIIFSEENHYIIVELNSKFSKTRISLYGAQVLSFTPKGERDLLFLSKESYYQEGKAIRGGIPVCWPWFGAHPTDTTKSSHGFARLSKWQVKSSSSNNDILNLQLELNDSENTRKIWPYKFKAIISITVGKTLSVELTTLNTDKLPFTITSALHSYLNISNSEKINISGLEDTRYMDDVKNIECQQAESLLSLQGEIDRRYIKTSTACTIDDSNYKRKIKISKKGSEITVVWNPGPVLAKKMIDLGDMEYQNMVCIEAANTLNDSIHIQPGQKHSLSTTLELE